MILFYENMDEKLTSRSASVELAKSMQNEPQRVKVPKTSGLVAHDAPHDLQEMKISLDGDVLEREDFFRQISGDKSEVDKYASPRSASPASKDVPPSVHQQSTPDPTIIDNRIVCWSCEQCGRSWTQRSLSVCPMCLKHRQ